MRSIRAGIIYSMGLYIIILSSAHARWATQADVPSKNSYTQEFNVNSDGTFEALIEENREILNEIGRDISTTNLFYKEDCQKIKVLDAKTIYKGKEYKLDKKMIEDKPLASDFGGFDQSRQLLLAFPKAEIGARLYLKYKFIQKTPPLANFFAEMFYFGKEELVASSRIRINSKLPLHILVNDPEKALKVTKKIADGLYRVEIILTKPVCKLVSDEAPPIVRDDKYLIWVAVSSLGKWEDLAVRHSESCTKVITQKLPADFALILKAAQEKTTAIEQINTVTSLLNDKIRYMGDWRSIRGRLVPRDLAKISQSQMGDCKDFAAATAAILTKLGFKAQIALVMRGVDNLSKPILPSFEAFNHAMLKVTGKDGVVYWIDPTNFASMANGIFPDIANKMALVLDLKQPRYEKIPGVNPLGAEINIKRQLTIVADNKIIETGSLLLKNEWTLGLTGGALRGSEASIKDAIFYLLADEVHLDDKSKKSMNLPKLTSRIVKDIAVTYSFERENEILKTNVGSALKVTDIMGLISGICGISQDYVAEALFGKFPAAFKRQTIIKNVAVQNAESLNKEIKTSWLDVKRECNFNSNHELQIDETIIIYKNLIPSEDFKKPEFIELKKWLKNNFKDTIIVFKQE